VLPQRRSPLSTFDEGTTPRNFFPNFLRGLASSTVHTAV
jgi:hypothetical protein